MGIPLYFKIISDKYPDIIIKNINNNKSNALFLDLNCAIHPCCRKIMSEYNGLNNDKLELKMINETINYINKLVNMVNPELLYIAIDGVAPCAKMNQQRFRRYKSVVETQITNNIKEKCGEPVNYNNWNTNAISPGTEFMDNLSSKINHEISNNSIYSNINVIFSDMNTPGEGEHKILDYIKNNIFNGNLVIYGLDADLIMLSFVSGKNNIYLLRESVEFGKVIPEKYLFLNIDILKFFIIMELKDIILQKDSTFLYKEEYNKVLINDYIFLCLFVGNDFIPHLTSISLRNKSLPYLLDKYMEVFINYKLTLISEQNGKLKINNQGLFILFKLLENDEDKLLIEFSQKRKKFKYNKFYNNPRNTSNNTELNRQLDIHNNYPILNQDAEKYIDIGKKGWELKYYEKCLKIYEFDEIENVVLNYLTGLKWVFEYYFNGCSNWSWKYNYLYSPTLKDIFKYFQNQNNINDIIIKKNKPYNVIVQMLGIFPKTSRNLIPIKYRKLKDSDSEIVDYYPDTFELSYYYKRYFWECEPILPILDFERINKLFKKK